MTSKEMKIEEAKHLCKKAIISQYPDSDQRNISMKGYNKDTDADYLEADLTTMKAFIKDKIEQYEAHKVTINAYTDSQDDVLAVGELEISYT